MGMTITEKIIAHRTNAALVKPGEIYDVPVDVAFTHDNNAPLVMQQFSKLPGARVWDPDRIFFVLDHHSPSTSFRAAQHHSAVRDFIRRRGGHLFDVGRGVSHPVLAEEGVARPGRIIVGTDSHTVGLGAFGCLATGIGATEMAAVLATGKIWMQVPETVKVILEGKLPLGVCARDIALFLLNHFGPSFLNYRAVEFEGTLLDFLSVEERMAITVMTLESGVKNSLMPVDEKLLTYLKTNRSHESIFTADSDAGYASVTRFDVSDIPPFVAVPALPTNGMDVSRTEGVAINQATLGSCAGAFYHDLAQAAEIVSGKKIHPGVRFVIVPNTSRVMAEAARTGVMAALVEAGAIVSSPSCGTCAGYEIGCLAPGEVCISTTTRNVEGRMGAGGQVYLASARTVAASALAGCITDPRKLQGSASNDG